MLFLAVRVAPACPATWRMAGSPVAFVATDDVAAFEILLRRVYEDHAGVGYSHFIVGLHERGTLQSAPTHGQHVELIALD